MGYFKWESPVPGLQGASHDWERVGIVEYITYDTI